MRLGYRALAGLLLWAAAALSFAAPSSFAATAPHVAMASLAELPTPLPLPYDTSADADSQVAAAQKLAAKTGKLLLIDLGGNWCPDCRILAAVMALPEVKRFIAAHYVVVTVDIGRLDKNLQIPARFGVKDKLEGVPSLLIVDPKTSRLLDQGHIAALADARSSTPQALADWLAQWVPP